jgi:radical SAM superfamily enzyme YgiQ (UPF0313 family)
MGVDSGDPDIRRHHMERPMTDEVLLRAGRTIMDAGIGLHVSCMFGIPGETAEQMWKTVGVVDEMRPDQASGFIFYPFPKTKMYHLAVEQGYLGPGGEMVGRARLPPRLLLKHPEKDPPSPSAKRPISTGRGLAPCDPRSWRASAAWRRSSPGRC